MPDADADVAAGAVELSNHIADTARIEAKVSEAAAICGLCVRARRQASADLGNRAAGIPLASVDFERLLGAP